MKAYLHASRNLSYTLIATLPLLLCYELLLFFDQGQNASLRNAADVWVRWLFMSFGLHPRQITWVMLLVVALAIPLACWKSQRIRAKYFAFMLLESILLSLGLFLLMGLVPRLLQLTQAIPLALGVLEAASMSLGAGIFEELVFRVVPLTLLVPFFTLVFQRLWALLGAILISALLFSLAHYFGAYADVFTLASFTARMAAGIFFSLLYLNRGFAITAYTHTLYDLGVFFVFP